MAAADDHPGRLLVAPGLVALGRLAPRAHRMPAARGATLAAAVRMVDRVHGHAAIVRAPTLPAHPAGLAVIDVLMVRVGNGPDRRHALGADLANLARAQTDLAPVAVTADQLRERPGRARDLAAGTGLELDIVDDRADRHALQRRRVAGLHVDAVARDHLVAGLQPLRRQDVGLLAVLVLDERDERRPVRVVLEPLDGGDHAPLGTALEVDQPVGALVATAAEPGRRPAQVVAPARAVQTLGQLLDRLALVQ